MGITAYDIVFTIIMLCVIGLLSLISRLLSFIFQKLNLTSISKLFDEIKLLFITVLPMMLAVIIAISLVIGLYLLATHIANFIFALF